MDATNVLGLCWVGAGIILVLGAIGWALLRMTIRALIYLGGMITLIILGGQSFGWGPMIGIGGLALLGGPVGAAVLLVPLGILTVLGPKPRGGSTQTIPTPATNAGDGGEVEYSEQSRPPRQICSKGCVILADGEIVSVPECRLSH